jgi:hypothetical protein
VPRVRRTGGAGRRPLVPPASRDRPAGGFLGEDGGIGHVDAYLANLDLSDFDPRAAAEDQAFWAIDSDMADVLDRLGNPDVVTLTRVADHADGNFAIWLCDRKNYKKVGYLCGYAAVRNQTSRTAEARRQALTVYAKACLSVRERYLAAQQLAERRG